jgi:hypothetical protein
MPSRRATVSIPSTTEAVVVRDAYDGRKWRVARWYLATDEQMR